MQQRAGLLFLAKTTGRILLILEDQRWTVPTFVRSGPLLEDAENLLDEYTTGRILPIELYLSEDRGFEYGTYVCVVDQEFLNSAVRTVCWADLDDLPKQLHLHAERVVIPDLYGKTVKAKAPLPEHMKKSRKLLGLDE
jgi:hypothetical protein